MLNEDFEAELLRVRQALTNSIAVEKQIEQQIEKNKQSMDGWQKRVQMARESEHEEMAKQAEERIANLVRRNNELEIEHMSQKDFSANLKKEFSRLESKRYSVGSGAAEALASADATLANVDRMEEKIRHHADAAEAMNELTKPDEVNRHFEEQKKKEAIDNELEALKASLKKDS